MKGIIKNIDRNQSRIEIEIDGLIKNITIKQGKKNFIKLDDIKEGYSVELGNHPSGKKEIIKVIDKNLNHQIKVIKYEEIKSASTIKDSEKLIAGKLNIRNEEIGKDLDWKYPYNFISSDFNKPVKSSYEKGNYTGYIDIELQNTSPLLIAEEIKKEKVKIHLKNHKGEYIIPASSFKGMIRNTVEILTNSCYSVLEDRGDKEIQDFRLDFNKKKALTNLKVYPGRIVKIDGELKFEKLEEAWINDKVLSNEDKLELDGKNQPKKPVEMEVAENNGWDGKRFIPGINIVETDYDKNKIKKKSVKRVGYIKDTGINFGNTHHQRFFYEKGEREYFGLEEKVIKRYKEVLKRQKKENEDNYIKNGGKNKFITTYHHEEARPGALLWGIYDEKRESLISLSYIQTPKMAYYMLAKELLGELSQCEELEELCYSCRMFGTVIKDTKQALKGKLEFEDLIIQNIPSEMEESVKMDILDSPRPSNSNFYVNKNFNSYDDINATIRGRKIFWHHKDKQDIHDEKQLRMSNIVNENASTEQSSLIKPLLSGNNFKGKIYFRSLTEIELGSLMYALGEEKTLHKIGAGKPLGMGSIKIIKKDLYLEDKNNKYTSFKNTFNCIDSNLFVNEYKQDIEKKIGEKFDTIKFIKEYKRYNEGLVDFSKENYPKENGNTGKNTLEWFMKNKNTKLPEALQYKK